MSTDAPPAAGRRQAASSTPDDGLGRPAEVPKGGRRDRIRKKPGVGHAYRVGVFVAGLLCIAAGIALAVLPGPLTIPPVLLGLWIWSTEFRFAERFFDSFKGKAKEAWSHTKAHQGARRPSPSAVLLPPAPPCGRFRTSSSWRRAKTPSASDLIGAAGTVPCRYREQ